MFLFMSSLCQPLPRATAAHALFLSITQLAPGKGLVNLEHATGAHILESLVASLRVWVLLLTL